MKKINIIKNSAIASLGIFSFIISLIKFINTYYYGNYGDSFEISFSDDYLVGMLVSLILVTYGVITLINTLKNKENNPLLFPVTGGLYATVVSFYTLGYAFKQMNKHKDFDNYQNYLYVGIFFLIILIIFVCSYLTNSKKKD